MSFVAPTTAWVDQVADATRREPALLAKTERKIFDQYEKGLSVVRFAEHFVTAHATLWQLKDNWFELGTVWVHREFRGHDLSADLYRELFAKHPHKNIIATTTNPASLRIGLRVGMRCIPFSALPPDVWRETCCCPAAKTGSNDNIAHCQQRGYSCFVRVTRSTYLRLGSPPEIDVTPYARRPPSP